MDYNLPGSSLSVGFLRQEYLSELPRPSPGDLPNPRIEPASVASPALTDMFFTTSTTWKSPSSYVLVLTFFHFVATPLRVVPAFVLLCLNIPFLLLHLFSTYVIDFLHWIPSVKIDSVHLPSLFNLSCFSFLRFKMEMMMMMIMMIIILSSLGCWWPLSSRSLD